jgi:Holliday junction resolvasome RuvABC DNA-binding subunit
MNQQPSESAGAVWAFIFVLGIAIFAIKAFLEGHKNTMPSDLFTLGYIENKYVPTPIMHSTTNNYKSTNKVTNVNKTVQKTQNNKITQLQLDCIDTLTAVGYKKMIARKMVLDYFKEHNPVSVQDFISRIFKQ